MKRSQLASAVKKALKANGGRALNKGELLKAIGPDPSVKTELRGVLTRLLKQGEIQNGKKGKFELVEKSKEFTPKKQRSSREPRPPQHRLVGTFRQHPKGFGWFYPDLTIEANREGTLELDASTRVKVPDRYIGVAIDGDTVALELLGSAKPEWQKRKDAARKRRGEPAHPSARFDDIEGKITDVLERREGAIVGTYFDRGRFKNVQPDDGSIPQIDITDSGDALSGQKVTVQLERWDDPDQRPVGKVTEVLGWPESPGVDIVSVIKRHNLRQEFDPAILAEAEKCPKSLSAAELDRRWDCRDQLIVTVDPFDARDHDDACFVERTPKGDWVLSVHIADVSHFVKPGSALDKEAQKRGNSTYLVDRVLPMLPKLLSNELCSLTPDDDSATKCAQITFSPEGEFKKAAFADAVIRSKARLSYEDAQEMIDGDGGGEVGDVIRDSWKLASLLRKRRFAQGALDMEFPETKVLCDEKGRPYDIKLSSHSESHQMIEEFMLAANEAVARALRDKQRPTVYRIHENPDDDRLVDFTETARAHGYQPGDLTNRKHIQKLLDAARGKPEEYAIKLGLLKSLKRASYSVEPVGHYGLNKSNYCHFTSPIRRYADLIVHRSLQALLVNRPKKLDRTPKQAEASEICQHISQTERTSAEAEIETKRMKQMEFLEQQLESGSLTTYQAVITDVRKMGLFIECPAILQRGVVRREDVGKGNWRFDANNMCFTLGKRKIALGDKITVRLKRIDSVQNFVDFKIVEKERVEN